MVVYIKVMDVGFAIDVAQSYLAFVLHKETTSFTSLSNNCTQLKKNFYLVIRKQTPLFTPALLTMPMFVHFSATEATATPHLRHV